ncbi:hypothetical protein Ae201684P_012795 [Aphanomyces euteiches]|nr:hypothetical protein Ae201684P_012795 [Aphanomyces euteiches]
MEKASRPRTIIAVKPLIKATSPKKQTIKKKTTSVDVSSRLKELQKSTKSSACKIRPSVKAPSNQTDKSPTAAPSPEKPKSTGAFKVRAIEKTKFCYFCAVRKVQWQVDITQIDYTHYLPLFFEGLREIDEPYKFLALNGTLDMLEKGGDKPLSCIPHLVIPIKQNLMTRHPTIMCIQMKVLQKLVLCCPYAGEALVPYYRQLLTIFNLFITNELRRCD